MILCRIVGIGIYGGNYAQIIVKISSLFIKLAIFMIIVLEWFFMVIRAILHVLYIFCYLLMAI